MFMKWLLVNKTREKLCNRLMDSNVKYILENNILRTQNKILLEENVKLKKMAERLMELTDGNTKINE